MDDLYGSTDETTIDEEGLRQWFKGGGWRQAGGKYDGKPCARQPGQKTTPKCVSRKKYKSMSKKERESAGRRKRKKDPGQTKKRGAAKPTYVKTDPQKGGRKKKSKKKNEELYMDLEQMIREELKQVNEGMGTAILATTLVFALATKLLGRKPESDEEAQRAVQNISDEDRLKLAKEVAQQAIKDMESKMSYEAFADAGMPDTKPATNLGFDRSAMKPAKGLEEIVKEELEAVLDEKRKKKKKKKAKRDACYHKVKSRYKVWPSAYASGALVKCRKVGAKNWGNSTKESLEIEVQNTIFEVLNESHSKEDEEKLKDIAKALRKSSKMHGEQAEDIQDIIDRSPNDELDESHSKEDEETLQDIAGQLKKASKLHAGQADKIQKIVDDSDDSKLREDETINESPNCGCGSDPCQTYGKNGEKIVIMIKEEMQAVLDEKKKKKKSAKDRMKCNSSRRIRKGEAGYGKKKFVVKACEGGTEKIIRYGDANMEIKKDSPARRKSFRARHNCKNPGSKLKARYWSCKKW